MARQILFLAGAVLLFAGTVQAEAPGAQSEQTTIARNEAFVFSATNTEIEAARNCDATSKLDKNEATEERHAEARPAYLNGGN
ncbi:MAG TPA: hypothetical protein VFO43_05045 [Thiobacillus sp.]|nr:hypothetical protein [Thiobacillus sp.]